MAGKDSAIPYHCGFIGNNAVKIYVIPYHGILHKYGILYGGASANLYATEENTVFHGAFDNASVRNKRIFGYCGIAVLGGSAVASLGEYGSVCYTEQLSAGTGVKQVHIAGKIICHRVYGCEVSVAHVSLYLVSADTAGKNVLGKALVAVGGSIQSDFFQILTVHNVNIKVYVAECGLLRIVLRYIGNVAVFIVKQLYVVAGSAFGYKIRLLCCNSAVRTGLYVILDDRGKIHIADNVAIRKYNVFFLCALNKRTYAHKSLETGGVYLGS